MAAERTIPVDPESTIKELFAQVEDEPVVVSVGRERFRIVREKKDIWANYDPEKARAAIRAAAGALASSGIDFDAWNEEIREQRGQYSAGRPYDE
ncbi:MAG: hypothetical protein IT334_02505 [Thermomicrobiales bacterium]|nr:hypothetical protein [Thermomicrobiales bacterium]